MIQLINIQTLKIIKTFQGHSDTVEALSFLPCTFNKEENDTLTLLASGGLDGVCHIWDYR
jgi:WD40 repeat protein